MGDGCQLVQVLGRCEREDGRHRAGCRQQGIVLTTKSKKADRIRKPAKLFNKVTLNKTFRKVAKTIIAETSGNYYRGDLQNAALAKWSIIAASQKRSGESKTPGKRFVKRPSR